jgi:hypothetical protein
MPPSSAITGRSMLFAAAVAFALIGGVLFGSALGNTPGRQVELFIGLDLMLLAVLVAVTLYAVGQVCQRLDHAAARSYAQLERNGVLVADLGKDMSEVRKLVEDLDARIDSVGRALEIGIDVGQSTASIRPVRDRQK